MPATFSPEGQLNSGLRDLGCAPHAFVRIAKQLGVGLSQGLCSMCLTGKRTFNAKMAERLLDTLTRMKSLQSDAGLPLNWTRDFEISKAIAIRRVNEIALELGDDGFNVYAERATNSVK